MKRTVKRIAICFLPALFLLVGLVWLVWRTTVLCSSSETFGRIEIWQRQLGDAWSNDECLAYGVSSNIIVSIKAAKEMTLRMSAVSRYVDFLLTLDLKVQEGSTDPVIVRRHLLEDAFELLGDSEDSIFEKWRLRLKYRQHLKQEHEWLETAARTNQLEREGMTIRAYSNTKEGQRLYRLERDVRLRKRREVGNLKTYADYLKEELQRDERIHDGDELMNDTKRMSTEKKKELLRLVNGVLGRE